MAFDFTGDDVIREAKRISPKVLLSFSTGKDSIGAALALRNAGFEDIQPFYMYQVPGNLEFIEESLVYYERVLFNGRRIVRLPHPYIQRSLRNLILQPPERVTDILAMDIEPYNATDLQESLSEWLGWPEDTLTALGVRAADSQNRYTMFKRLGMAAAINPSSKKFYPIFDWNKETLLSNINKAGVKLPVDYRVFGKTFDGFDLRFLYPLKKHFPRDYERVKFWWPMCDVEFFRYEHRTQES